MSTESKKLPESPHLKRELIRRIDQKHRHDARRAGKGITLDGETVALLTVYRERWIELLGGLPEIADKATLHAVARAYQAEPGVDEERARAIRSVTWADIRKARNS